MPEKSFKVLLLYLLKKSFFYKPKSLSQTLLFWAPKSLQMVTAAMKLKDTYSLEGKL